MRKQLLEIFRLYAKARAQGYTVLGLFRRAFQLTAEEIEYEEHMKQIGEWMDEIDSNRYALQGHNDWEELI